MRSSLTKKEGQLATLQKQLREAQVPPFCKSTKRVAHAVVCKSKKQPPPFILFDIWQIRAKAIETQGAEARKRVEMRHSEAEAARQECVKFREQRDAAADERKSLWREEQHIASARRVAAEDLDKAQRTLQHSMSPSQWQAACAVKRIAAEKRMRGVHGNDQPSAGRDLLPALILDELRHVATGMLIELFTVDETFYTAYEVMAGNQLFHFVVDTDEIAQV